MPRSLVWLLACLLSSLVNSPARAAGEAASGNGEFAGVVLDDETGKPVTDFAVQWGLQEKPDQKIKWGYGLGTSSNRPKGRFHETSGWATGTRVTVRIIADGYVPQPVTDEPRAVPTIMTNLVVRLKRGSELHGVVFDHLGKPADQAKVYVADAQPLELTDGIANNFKGSTATTDVSGQFVLKGLDPAEDHRIVAISAGGIAALAKNPPIDKPLSILLPEPASLTVKYDILNDQPEATLRIELKTWESDDWKGINIVREPKVANQKQIEITDLSPGTYDFIREKMIQVGGQGHGVFCDRQTITLKPGEKQTVDLSRPNGRSITGEIVGMQDAQVPGAFIVVRSAQATGDPRAHNEWKLPLYDGTIATPEHPQFKTAGLLPGTYSVLIEAYLPETPEQRRSTGIRLPDYIAKEKVTVGPDADPAPLKIELKAFDRKAGK